jgi:emfourin
MTVGEKLECSDIITLASLSTLALAAIGATWTGCGDQNDGPSVMRVEFKTEGGVAHFPGMGRPVVIDAERLTPEESSALQNLVDGARFFEIDDPPPPPSSARDYLQYTITITEKARRRTLRVTDLTADASMQRLIQYLRAVARAQRPTGAKPPD